MRQETGLFERLFNAITHSGTTITRTTGFFGGRKTIVRNYDTGITKEYSHDRGFLGNRTDVKVYRRVGRHRRREKGLLGAWCNETEL